jgi:hypothetical protein
LTISARRTILVPARYRRHQVVTEPEEPSAKPPLPADVPTAVDCASPVAKLSPLAAATALAVVAVLAVGCSNDDSDAPDASPKGPARPAAPHRAEHIPGETVTEAPVLPDGEVVAQAVNVSGNRELEVKGGLKSGPLAVLVNCKGKGRLTVEVEPVGLNFPLKCVAGEVSSTYNQLDLKNTREQGTVSVTAPSTVHWAITVGRRGVSRPAVVPGRPGEARGSHTESLTPRASPPDRGRPAVSG